MVVTHHSSNEAYLLVVRGFLNTIPVHCDGCYFDNMIQLNKNSIPFHNCSSLRQQKTKSEMHVEYTV